MKIVLATPLYPPDVAWPAPYIKELARRLAPIHEVTVVAYGDLPEQVERVRIVATDKRRPLPLRLMAYTRALWHAAKAADLIYAENGASVELPLSLVSLFVRTPIVMHLGDERAHQKAGSSIALHVIEKIAQAHAKKVVADSPAARPEVLPFAPYPTNGLAAYEASWQKHLEELADLFVYARQ
jgi:hypothetical protein